jgi:hypothetical protein
VSQAIEFEKPPHFFIGDKATVQVLVYRGKVLLLKGLLNVGNIFRSEACAMFD